MDKTMMIASILGATAVTAGGAGAITYLNQGDYAEVIKVEPIEQVVRTPREECRDQAVTRQAPTKDPNRVTGTVIGAIAGGVLGNQVGDGSGRKAATVAGAAAGGYAGNKIQEKMQAGNTVQTTETVCETAYDTHKETVAYEVTYRWKEEVNTVRMEYDPGGRIRVENDKPVLDDKDEAS